MHLKRKQSHRWMWLVPLLLCTALIAGCGDKQETLLYVGQSDNWKALLTVIHTADGKEEQQVLRLSYKSADIDSVYNVRYRLAGLAQEVSGSEDDMNNKSSIIHRTSCTGCEQRREDSTFTVTVDWSPNRNETFPVTFVRKE
ncbi:hypothetical protein AM501_07125 [Aneurinibacillus migulanus]|nr:hypothetical protein TS64_17670 [Aneurinibacillus migulanus]KIV58710.1 hypothetical protein TS65_04885 [Aneurinibacillus migulanus]KON96402.1 hypothetical protein AF333_13875 [Aneurinibacillus migulanus]KPD08882.1 hypothetical protein AM501_07125 [Aneurinibacillus migulanus]